MSHLRFYFVNPYLATVPQKLKQKIGEDRFIDLAALFLYNLMPGSENCNYKFKLENNDNISVEPKKNKQSINNIFRSTTAYLRFVAIDAENFSKCNTKFHKKGRDNP